MASDEAGKVQRDRAWPLLAWVKQVQDVSGKMNVVTTETSTRANRSLGKGELEYLHASITPCYTSTTEIYPERV